MHKGTFEYLYLYFFVYRRSQCFLGYVRKLTGNGETVVHLPSTFHKLPRNSPETFGSQTRKSPEEGQNEAGFVLITIVCNTVPFTTVLCL